MLLRFLKRLLCIVADHQRISDGTWGGYGWTCPRCGKNDCGIHDM